MIGVIGRLAGQVVGRYGLVIGLVVLWQVVIGLGVIPDYLLPSPKQIVVAFFDDIALLAHHVKYILLTAFS